MNLKELARETAEASAGLSYDGKTELILAALRQAVEDRDALLCDMATVIRGDYDPDGVLTRYEAMMKEGK